MAETFTHGSDKYEIQDGQCYRFLTNGMTLPIDYRYRMTGTEFWMRNSRPNPGCIIGRDTARDHEFAIECEDPRTFADRNPMFFLIGDHVIDTVSRIPGRIRAFTEARDTPLAHVDGDNPGCKYCVPVSQLLLFTASQVNETQTIQLVGQTPKPAPFFMVNGSGPSTVRHAKAFDAIREAERLARENPGVAFHILQSIRTVTCGTLTHTTHAASPIQDGPDDDVPF